MKLFLRTICCLCGALALCWSGLVHADQAPWPDVPFKYFARQEALPTVLHGFATTFGLQLEVGPDVEGTVSGNYATATPREFLNSIASSYGLEWYAQGGVLHVEKSLATITRVLHVGLAASDVGALKEQLINLGVFEPRFGWAEFPQRGVVIVSGPQAYVKEIVTIVDALGTAPSDGRQIRIFRLENARAEDYAFSYHDQHVVTPGVATLLRSLAMGSMAEQQAIPSTGALSVAHAQSARPLPSLQPLAGIGALLGDQSAPSAATTTPAGLSASGGGDVSVRAGLNVLSPVIEADPRLNAVIVYDAPEKMPIYESLIRQLDAGRPQIEIEALIVDVDTDSIDTLGVAWEGHAGDAKFGFGGSRNQATILSINTDSFVARVRALSTQGHAHILGRPSVLTIDNLAAVLSTSETFYARSSLGGGGGQGGVGAGAVVPITTGTMLKVIPRLLEENSRRDVSLAVEIEDGQIRRDPRQDPGALPTVMESRINTQTVIHEDDSLLIGGYFMDNDSEESQRVPGLSRIPVLGALFRDKHTDRHRSARLFIIRPHVVTTPVAG
jgi:type III secretion protein C